MAAKPTVQGRLLVRRVREVRVHGARVAYSLVAA